jgi:DNA-binding NtrC family response regulator/tetratricopeptide (TPR) repeat protein
MPHVVADRFVQANGSWIDLATGADAHLRIVPAGARRDELLWNTSCAALASLRHPLLNPLIDYGVVDNGHLFEAYEKRAPIVLTRKAEKLAVAHAIRFMRAHDVVLGQSHIDFVLRRVVNGRSICPRLIGVVLQHRRVFEILIDAFEPARPGGVCTVSIRGAPQSGLRTTRLLAARAVRLHGYLPIASVTIDALPWLHEYSGGRHVCVLGTTDCTRATPVACLLTRLSVESPRRHILLLFDRLSAQAASKTVTLERMGVAAMSGMVFVDSEHGPSPDEIFAAARAAGGRPGTCLERLGAGTYEPILATHFTVHEVSQSYGAASAPASTAEQLTQRRTSGVVGRAVERSESLVARGRHSAAERVLERALRVHRGRGASAEAAHAALRLGYLALDRGRIDRAVLHFRQARDGHTAQSVTAEASLGLGLAWIENGRLVDAEAVLRTTASTSPDDHDVRARASIALSRCLFWMGRLDEAMVALEDTGKMSHSSESRAAAMRSRILLAEGLIPAAVRSARVAAERSAEREAPRIRAAAFRALAAAVAAAGDDSAATMYIREGLKTAQSAHLPLMAARLRLTFADVAGNLRREQMRRLVARVVGRKYTPLLQAIARAVLARLDDVELDAATRAFIAASGAMMIGRGTIPAGANPVAELESFLNLGHTAADDRSALEQIAATLQEKVRATTILIISSTPDRRVLCLQGRPWSGEPHVAWRAVGGGVGIGVDAFDEPCQGAEPVRYGGEIIGAVAARWTAGAAIDAARAAALLRVAALALASHVRAMLDRSAPPSTTPAWDDLLGESPQACTLRESISRAARAPFPVLIQGESGSGKELVARAIHKLGPRRERRFCALNCAALSDELIEAELFGHARGAFTGAVTERAGLFEEADGGSLFLDEIGELSARAQAKLLRVLQDGEVRRVGENLSRRVDVRIIAATNRRLEQEAAAGRFRSDLRFRLDVVRIEVPPLRDRASDVPLLAARFWNDAAGRVGSRATLTPDAMAALTRYEWPGNVRELQNVIAWVAVQSPRRGRIGHAGLPAHVAQAGVPQETTFEAAREEFERRFVKAALDNADGQRARAAHALGITRQGLAKMMRRLGLDRKE